jgi:hypothetical protein
MTPLRASADPRRKDRHDAPAVTATARWGWAVMIMALGLVVLPARAEEDARTYVEFAQDFTANCVARQGVQILVKNRHATRTLRVWLDRYHMGVGTGDRSRTDLAPDGPPEPLGCSRSTTGVQEWRLVRASFID